MTHLVWFACPGLPSKEVQHKYREALSALGDFALVWIALPGLSSVFHGLGSSLRRGGRIIPQLLERYPAPNSARPTTLSLICFSAGYGLAYELLTHAADRAALDGLVLLDGLHTGYDADGTAKDVGLKPFVEYSSLAIAGDALFAFGHTDVHTYHQYASTTESADELIRLAAPEGGMRDVAGDHYKTRVARGSFVVRAYNLHDNAHQKQEHGAALITWGPGLVAELLVPHLQRLAPSSTTTSSPSTPPTSSTLPSIRRGAAGPAVVHLQERLGILADGRFGPATEGAVENFQAAQGLKKDGIVGPKTWAALEALGTPEEFPPRPPFGALDARGRVDLFGRFSYEPSPRPGDPEGIRITDGWVQRNITRVEIPQIGRIPGVNGQGAGPKDGAVYCHRLVAEQLRALWQAWEDAGLLSLVLTWGGLWVPRFIRGSKTTLSNHAFGSAFDINAPWNALGAAPAARGAKGSVRELVPLAHEHGWFWGGHFGSRSGGRYDGMHFEVARII